MSARASHLPDLRPRTRFACALAALAVAAATAAFAPLARAQQTPGAAAPDATARLQSLIERVRAAGARDDAALREARAAGFASVSAGRFDAAAAIFDAVREVMPADRAALYGGALARFNLGRIPEAEVLARRAADGGDSPPSSGEIARADVLVLLGVILAVKGDNVGALAAVAEAATLAPSNFDAQFALGRARFGAGDPAGAAKAFRVAVALRPGDARARFFLATALENAGDDAAALDAYRELVALNSQIAEGHMGVGVLLVKRGGAQIDEGIAALERAVSLNGALYEGRVALGRALIRRGRPAAALAHLRRAAELAPDNPEPHYQLSLAYRRLGRTAEADAERGVVKKLHEAHRGRSDKTAPEMSSAAGTHH